WNGSARVSLMLMLPSWPLSARVRLALPSRVKSEVCTEETFDGTLSASIVAPGTGVVPMTVTVVSSAEDSSESAAWEGVAARPTHSGNAATSTDCVRFTTVTFLGDLPFGRCEFLQRDGQWPGNFSRIAARAWRVSGLGYRQRDLCRQGYGAVAKSMQGELCKGRL